MTRTSLRTEDMQKLGSEASVQKRMAENMTRFQCLVTVAACLALHIVALTSSARAQDSLEVPPSSTADQVLGSIAKGENYVVESPVRSDGLLQIFTIRTDAGRFTVHGRQLLDRRLRELKALAALDRLNSTEVFTQSAVKSAASPIKFGLDLLSNPFGTVDQTVSGVSNAFDKIGAGVSNAGVDPDGLAASAIGVGSAKRQLAAELSVDPYTDFPPLAKKLNDVATTVALGVLGPKAAYSLIGGGAGMAISYSGTAEDVRNLVRDKTPSQLYQRNAEILSSMGTPNVAVHAFLDNPFYTLTDQTRIVEALQQLKTIENRSVFVERAAGADSRDLAFFLVRRVEMIADHQRASGGQLVKFISAGGLPVNIASDGNALVIAPIDLLSWSATPLQALAAITSSLRSDGYGKSVELIISGKVTPRALDALKSMGWKVTEAGRS